MLDGFPRTRSALEADRSRSSILGALAGILVLVIWGFALVFDRPVLEVSSEARVEKGASTVRVEALFGGERGFGRFRSGQRAWVTLREGARLQGTVVAVSGNGALRVELALEDEASARALASSGGPAIEAVAVEVERTSPARRVLRAAGGR